MQRSPLIADEAPTAQTVTQAAPLINAAPQLLWTGFAAFIVIFLIVFFLLSRWRADRRTRTARNTDYFQPAGENAEITFDDAVPARSGPQVGAIDDDGVADQPPMKKRGPFAGLFNKRDKPVREAPAPGDVIELAAEEEEFASVRIERPAPAPSSHREMKEPAVDWAAIERADRERVDAARRREEEAEARREEEGRRRLADEERRRFAEEDRRNAEREAAAREQMDRRATPAPAPSPQRFAETEHAPPHEDIVRTLSEVEEALHAQREAIQAETRSLLDSFARRFSDRLDSLAASVEKRAAPRPDAAATERPGEAAALAEIIARRLDDHQRDIAQTLSAMGKRVDALGAPDASSMREEMAKLRRALVGASAPSAPVVQLADVVRNALAPNAYELNAVLPGGKRADCLIKLARPPGPIAVDARFPVEAFHALHEGLREAESEFRRVALRHVVDVAERLIVPGVTADSAVLFLPSESMVAELHARFPDVVQDSWRARVWIVSPTGLMAILHTLSGLLRDVSSRNLNAAHSEAQRALAEVERLSERIAALESGNSGGQRSRTRRETKDDEPSRARRESYYDNPSDRRIAPAADNDEAPNGDLYDEAHTREEEAEPERTRPPFPLR